MTFVPFGDGGTLLFPTPPAHFYDPNAPDVVLISKHPRGLRALKDLNLLEQVVEHKQHFFREGGARYELAKKGTLRLAPGPRSKRPSAETTRI